MKLRTQSNRVFDQLQEVIPGGVNSPVRSCEAMGQNPLVVERGEADLVFDVDGQSYIDYCCSWGPLILGHCHPAVIDACRARMALGTTFGITTAIEEQLARKIVECVASVEQIRFVSSGTEATMSAARLARGFTGRDLIVKFAGNYHGHADFFLVQAGSGVATLNTASSSAGIPQDAIKHTVCLRYNNTAECRHFLRQNDVAAVILEPISANMGVIEATQEFLQMLREETAKQNALLIFDEVISGFRVGLQGAQGLNGIRPDLTCFGKIIGGGFPAGAFGGRKEIMDHLAPNGPVYQAGTLSGNPLAMEAGLQTIRILEREGFYEEIEEKTNIITEPVAEYIADNNLNACIHQVGSLFTLFFGKREVHDMDDVRQLNLPQFASFFRFLFERGVYAPPSQHEAWFVSAAHTQTHLTHTRDTILSFLSST